MKIATVCGMGLGTSLMLKMNIERALKNRGVTADIENVDLGSARSMKVDLIIAPKDMESQLQDFRGETIYISNLIDKQELQTKIDTYLDSVSDK